MLTRGWINTMTAVGI